MSLQSKIDELKIEHRKALDESIRLKGEYVAKHGNADCEFLRMHEVNSMYRRGYLDNLQEIERELEKI